MFSLSGEYAMRAMIYLARHQAEWPITRNLIADQADIPPRYLSKILADLVRAGVLEAARGRCGGFRFSKPARRIRLFDVLTPFEHFHHRHCPFGDSLCSKGRPCLGHLRWQPVIDAQQTFLRSTSIHDLALGQPKNWEPNLARECG